MVTNFWHVPINAYETCLLVVIFICYGVIINFNILVCLSLLAESNKEKGKRLQMWVFYRYCVHLVRLSTQDSIFSGCNLLVRSSAGTYDRTSLLYRFRLQFSLLSNSQTQEYSHVECLLINIKNLIARMTY